MFFISIIFLSIWRLLILNMQVNFTNCMTFLLSLLQWNQLKGFHLVLCFLSNFQPPDCYSSCLAMYSKILTRCFQLGENLARWELNSRTRKKSQKVIDQWKKETLHDHNWPLCKINNTVGTSYSAKFIISEKWNPQFI